MQRNFGGVTTVEESLGNISSFTSDTNETVLTISSFQGSNCYHVASNVNSNKETAIVNISGKGYLLYSLLNSVNYSSGACNIWMRVTVDGKSKIFTGQVGSSGIGGGVIYYPLKDETDDRSIDGVFFTCNNQEWFSIDKFDGTEAYSMSYLAINPIRFSSSLKVEIKVNETSVGYNEDVDCDVLYLLDD